MDVYCFTIFMQRTLWQSIVIAHTRKLGLPVEPPVYAQVNCQVCNHETRMLTYIYIQVDGIAYVLDNPF